MQISIKTPYVFEGSQVTVHIVGRMLYFENEHYDLGEVEPSVFEEIVKCHTLSQYEWKNGYRAYIFKE